jgi:hypothetical protein
VKKSIKSISDKVKPKDAPSIHNQFLHEIFDIVEANSDLMSFDYKDPWLPGEIWIKNRDDILRREVIAWGNRAEEIACSTPVIQEKLNELAKRFNMKVSSIFPRYPD